MCHVLKDNMRKNKDKMIKVIAHLTLTFKFVLNRKSALSFHYYKTILKLFILICAFNVDISLYYMCKKSFYIAYRLQDSKHSLASQLASFPDILKNAFIVVAHRKLAPMGLFRLIIVNCEKRLLLSEKRNPQQVEKEN